MAEERQRVRTSPSEEEQKSVATPEDFITKWPLYTPFESDNFNVPTRLSFHCEHCGKETTWIRVQDDTYEAPVNTQGVGFHWVAYGCNLCGREHLVVMYRVLATSQKPVRGAPIPRSITVVTKVQKVGQHPPLTINIPRPLERNLGKDSATLYKRSLVNRNEGYGLGAVTYIRRVVEDKTEDLIEVVAQLAEAHNIGEDVVEKIRAAKEERTTYDKKLQIASTVIPASLIVDGVNPLAVLFDLVSTGLHDLTEEQCIAIADKTKNVFEFTFTHLRAEMEKRQDFVDTLKKLADEKKRAGN